MFKRSKKNRIDELANKLAASGRVDALEEGLAKFNPLKLEEPEKESWFHLRGIAAFQRGDRDTAFARFLEARTAVPDSGSIAFSLAQEYEHRGEPAETFKLFDEFLFPKISAAYALAQARYAYLWGELERGTNYVNPVLEKHFELKVADDTFLYLRQMPFFSQTWAYFGALSELRGGLESVREVTRRAERELTSIDVTPLDALLDAISSGDFSAYTADTHLHSGYARTRAAVVSAQGSSDFESATSQLNEGVISESDFPWLRDILLVARAEAACTHGHSSEETLLREFFQRQPMLFEPDHAFNFRLLAYQERLRPIYQRSRIRGAA